MIQKNKTPNNVSHNQINEIPNHWAHNKKAINNKINNFIKVFYKNITLNNQKEKQ